jgi:hypothetical protein
MHVQNIDPNASVLSHEGKEYSGKEGVFDVPDALAAELVRFPHFRLYDGKPWPKEQTPEEVEAARIAALVQEAVAAAQAQASPQPKAPRNLAKRIAAARKKVTGQREKTPEQPAAQVQQAVAATPPQPKRRGRK